MLSYVSGDKSKVRRSSSTPAAAAPRTAEIGNAQGSNGDSSSLPAGMMGRPQAATEAAAVACHLFRITQQSCKTLCAGAVQSGAACACGAMFGCTFGFVEARATAGLLACYSRLIGPLALLCRAAAAEAAADAFSAAAVAGSPVSSIC
jgi:hypothetical protein